MAVPKINKDRKHGHTRLFTQKRHLNSEKLTARTRNGMTSIIINVDLTPRALKSPTEPRTESITRTTPERPRSTWKSVDQDK